MLECSLRRRIIYLIFALAFYAWTWNSAFGTLHEPSSQIILHGYISKEEFSRVTQDFTKFPSDRPLKIIINSNGGDLQSALELAKKIYERKAEYHLKVVVYIEDNAVGPAAIFPFLADELYASYFVSWGDIPLGNEKVYSTNILSSRVDSLIDPANSKASLLRLLATSMCDPAVRIIAESGWHFANKGEINANTISPVGQTLVINHYQMQELGIVKQLMTIDKFLSLYQIKLPAEIYERPYVITEPIEEPSSEGPSNEETSKEGTSVEGVSLKGATIRSEGRIILQKQFEVELKKYIFYDSIRPNFIGHVVIDDRTSGINQSTWLYVKKALDHYKETKPAFIILELNTPGGEVFAAQSISDALKEMDTQHNIPVIAFINNWAISAGAMLAYSCRFIVTAKDGSMGAAEPVIQGVEGKLETASEKVNSALRADFANRASFFGRNPLIAEAMVDKDMILVRRHGKIMKLANDSQIRSEGTDPDLIITTKGKLLTLDTKEMIEFGVADMVVPPTKTESIASEEQEIGRWSAQKMALFHQPFFKEIPNATIDSYRMDWKMRFFALLATPMVSSLLFLGLLLGVYLEFSTPGFGLPGTLAATCLFLIIISSYSLEIANSLEVVFLLVGLTVILVELFVLPTFGLLGFIGVLLFIVGLFGMMLPGIGSIGYELDTHSLNAAGQVVFERLAWLSGTLVVAFIIMIILARYATPSLSRYSRLVLKGNEQTGYIAGDNPSDLPPPGSRGKVIATLRPAGKIVISDKQYDAVSNGGFIEQNTSIVVVRLEGSVIVVESLKAHEESST